ncbi:MAG: hypothetical protein A3D28_01770 [Omnitrophica bacterium RIFCSPHIGHO2_02_FULL_63_14]|nr:MAG: hypothetical protein A3D28_01770 [Omnitrophica bacterium RIFCSPHIGHO2_02_FULL_63_14]
MPYDSNLDEKLYSKPWDGDGTRIVVSVYSYNKGMKKLQISRESANAEGEYRFGKLGRMTREEVEGILPLVQEALSHL